MRCVRCDDELDTPTCLPALDYRTGGLVCEPCHEEERETRAARYAFEMEAE